MILETGLFQADGHPGNMLAMKQGVVGLIDYGQSKQITDEERWKFAKLVIALAKYALPAKCFILSTELASLPR